MMAEVVGPEVFLLAVFEVECCSVLAPACVSGYERLTGQVLVEHLQGYKHINTIPGVAAVERQVVDIS